jgi:hypothetical protein
MDWSPKRKYVRRIVVLHFIRASCFTSHEKYLDMCELLPPKFTPIQIAQTNRHALTFEYLKVRASSIEKVDLVVFPLSILRG